MQCLWVALNLVPASGGETEWISPEWDSNLWPGSGLSNNWARTERHFKTIYSFKANGSVAFSLHRKKYHCFLKPRKVFGDVTRLDETGWNKKQQQLLSVIKISSFFDKPNVQMSLIRPQLLSTPSHLLFRFTLKLLRCRNEKESVEDILLSRKPFWKKVICSYF